VYKLSALLHQQKYLIHYYVVGEANAHGYANINNGKDCHLAAKHTPSLRSS